MKKELTKKETLTSGSGVVYYKLTFGNQWFNIMPWHYEPAKMMDVFKLCADAIQGESYDIKWRNAKVSGRPTTLITQINLVAEEFVWDGDEIGDDNTPNHSQEAHGDAFKGEPKLPYTVTSAKPLETITDILGCHMCGRHFDECNCEIPF